MRQVAKAIAERSAALSLPIPTTSAGGSLPTSSLYAHQGKSAHVSGQIDPYALPPFNILLARVQHYFQWTVVLYSFIHRETFLEMLYRVRDSTINVRRSWLGILNIMLALAQNIPVSDDVEAGEVYYHRAQLLCDQKTLDNVNLEVGMVLTPPICYSSG